MRRPRAFTVALVLALAPVTVTKPVAGQTGTPAVRHAITADSILQLDRAWGQAYVQGDSLLVQNLLAADWIGWFDDQEVDKTSELAGFRTGRNDIQEDIIDNAHVRVLGTTAVVQARERVRVADASGEHWETRHIPDVFLRRHGHWLVIASHDSRIPNPSP